MRDKYDVIAMFSVAIAISGLRASRFPGLHLSPANEFPRVSPIQTSYPLNYPKLPSNCKGNQKFTAIP